MAAKRIMAGVFIGFAALLFLGTGSDFVRPLAGAVSLVYHGVSIPQALSIYGASIFHAFVPFVAASFLAFMLIVIVLAG